MHYSALNQLVGNIDLYLLDQILKGRYDSSMRLLDVGCGEGRNLPYFVKNGFDVWGVDANPSALRLLRGVGKSWGDAFDPEKFIESGGDELPFPPARFDAVISCAVLHFARDDAHFFRMTDELARVLKPGGSLFLRMQAGEEADPRPPAVPFPLTSSRTDQLTDRYGFRWLEPLRTVYVAGETAHRILILEKP